MYAKVGDLITACDTRKKMTITDKEIMKMICV